MEQAFEIWNELQVELAVFFSRMYEPRANLQFINLAYGAILFHSYVNYDISKDFIPQLVSATEECREIMESFYKALEDLDNENMRN